VLYTSGFVDDVMFSRPIALARHAGYKLEVTHQGQHQTGTERNLMPIIDCLVC